MLTRRQFHTLSLSAAVAAASPWLPAPARAETMVGPDGLHTQPWFLQSFLNLAEDQAEARAAGKRFVIMWEQRGCIYCRDTHEINFADPKIAGYVRDNFAVLSLNLHGSRTVTDFDGEELEERKLARKYGIVFTPTFQFITDAAIDGKKPLKDVQSLNIKGYLKPPQFLALFEFVRDKGYDKEDFPTYLKGRGLA